MIKHRMCTTAIFGVLTANVTLAVMFPLMIYRARVYTHYSNPDPTFACLQRDAFASPGTGDSAFDIKGPHQSDKPTDL